MLRKLSPSETDSYLARIGHAGSLSPDAQTLARLHVAHLTAVAFENLDIHLGRAINLDPDALFDKIVRRKRGGFCYELNGLFARLLHSLGFEVKLLSARVGRDDGSLSPEFDHMTLLVALEQCWLADVGFGDSFTRPLHLTADAEQHESGKAFILTRNDAAWNYRARAEQGTWKTEYRFSTTPRQMADFAERCIWQQTSPDSHFTRGIVCTRITEQGRFTISGNRVIETRHGERREREIASETELRDLLREHFGIEGIDRNLLPR